MVFELQYDDDAVLPAHSVATLQGSLDVLADVLDSLSTLRRRTPDEQQRNVPPGGPGRNVSLLLIGFVLVLVLG